jgi:DEAD/DEAH box helicase domain-containing protein
MDVSAFLEEVRRSPRYSGQIVHMRELPARVARYAEGAAASLPEPLRRFLAARGIAELYTHQAQALEAVRRGRDLLVVTGTASGKSLCYTLPILESLCTPEARSVREPLCAPEAPGALREARPGGTPLGGPRALMLFPTKALCQDQERHLLRGLADAGLSHAMAGVYDGDTPDALRRRLRDHASILLTNPDMLHAALMPQHARWAAFLGALRYLVVDELHVYSGIFGANVANLFLRFQRICEHYGSRPQIVACSATVANPLDMARVLTGRDMALVDDDGSPRGRRTYVLWNPPRNRTRDWRSRRSANVEAHELMARLIMHGVPTITFSKAKITAEMIHRYVVETLQRDAPHLASRVTPYRGGYLPQERRDIERRLFDGELLGVSTTPALELGIDVGGLDASILVGYPGTLASFFQQSGRAGQRDRDALVILVGLDTAINQYILTEPDYIFDRSIESAVIEPHNPFVLLGHLRCAAQELPIEDAEAVRFGPHADLVLHVLEGNGKVRRIGTRWYHAASETPQHEISLRDTNDTVVLIEDADTGAVIGQVDKFDAPPMLHPDAIYLHLGDTYRVLSLDVEEKMIARVRRVEVDYYTQALGGTDVHHIDHALREKPFGTGRAYCGAGRAYWGEVTSYFGTWGYEKIHFYSLDAISIHPLKMPTFSLETMGFWIVAPDDLLEQVRADGLDPHQGLRGIGYATRMLLPLFMTCDTLDFSHSVGSANSPWQALFIYERYPWGLGFTAKAFERLDEILTAVHRHIRQCGCEEGCPCCVGKPLRQYATWNVERHEASIPSKRAALAILDGLLGDGTLLREPMVRAVEVGTLSGDPDAERAHLEQALRRRLERMREPRLFHPIVPIVPTAYPAAEPANRLGGSDAETRRTRRTDFSREIRRRIGKHIPEAGLSPHAPIQRPAAEMHVPGSVLAPTFFPGHPVAPLFPSEATKDPVEEVVGKDADCKAAPRRPPESVIAVPGSVVPVPATPSAAPEEPSKPPGLIRLGDSIAARARRMKRS